VACNTRRRPSRPPVPCTTTLRSRTVPHGGPESSRPGRLCVGVKLTASIIFFRTPETILVSASGLGLYDKLAQLVCVYAMHRGSAFMPFTANHSSWGREWRPRTHSARRVLRRAAMVCLLFVACGPTWFVHAGACLCCAAKQSGSETPRPH
jgi:hypothetical protein